MGHETSETSQQREYNGHSEFTPLKSDWLTKESKCVCTVIDHEFHYSFVKVAVDSFGYNHVNPQLLSQCYDEIHCQ